MIVVENVSFSTIIRMGDGVVAKFGDCMGIFYSEGVIINGKYIIGILRFVKDNIGNRSLISLEQHRNAPEVVYGRYRKLKGKEKNVNSCILNGISLPWSILRKEDVICILKGTDTFSFNCLKYKFAQELKKKYPNVNFAEVGSSNVGLNLKQSDIDIFIYNNYKKTIDYLYKNIKELDLKINRTIFNEDLIKHKKQYYFSHEKAKKICYYKLSGLEYKGKTINFIDARNNPVIKYIFKPNHSKKIIVNGIVVDNTYNGHHMVSYDIREKEVYSIVLVRGIFKKQKRGILEKGDSVNVEGIKIHKDPNVIIAEDLNLT